MLEWTLDFRSISDFLVIVISTDIAEFSVCHVILTLFTRCCCGLNQIELSILGVQRPIEGKHDEGQWIRHNSGNDNTEPTAIEAIVTLSILYALIFFSVGASVVIPKRSARFRFLSASGSTAAAGVSAVVAVFNPNRSALFRRFSASSSFNGTADSDSLGSLAGGTVATATATAGVFVGWAVLIGSTFFASSNRGIPKRAARAFRLSTSSWGLPLDAFGTLAAVLGGELGVVANASVVSTGAENEVDGSSFVGESSYSASKSAAEA